MIDLLVHGHLFITLYYYRIFGPNFYISPQNLARMTASMAQRNFMGKIMVLELSGRKIETANFNWFGGKGSLSPLTVKTSM